jgi:hypothetical protein
MPMTQSMTVRAQRDQVVPLISQLKLQDSATPLPCRGCTVNCPDYPQCQGKPWRLTQGLTGGT